MEDINLHVERLDHLGIIASTVRDLKIVDLINSRIKTAPQEILSTGEAVLAMILNGLGFTNEPLYLSPEFFSDKPLSNLFGRDDLKPENFNARKLGSCLDELYDNDLNTLFFELAVEACKIEEVNTCFKSLDTTSISLSGNYNESPEDENEIKITYGFSKDKRSDLKQLIHELLVTQDGGIPLMSKTWSGNESDVKIFQNRAKELLEQFDSNRMSDYLIADSKLYNADNAANLDKIQFITRIPNSIKKTREIIDNALSHKDSWINLNKDNKYQTQNVTHYNMEQRWIVVYSASANSRAKKSVEKKISSELSSFNTVVKQINKNKYTCRNDIKNAIEKASKKLKFHYSEYSIKEVTENKKSSDNRDKLYSVTCSVHLLEKAKNDYIEYKSCYVIGSNAAINGLSDVEIINRYKGQNKSIENMGFRFLKDPSFFVSSLFLKSPKRIESLLFIMTLSLLVYTIAQRKLRNSLEKDNETVPDQQNRPTQIPTLKWVFKLLKGINIVYITIDNNIHKIVNGITELKEKIINIFGSNARKIYGLQT